jgi:hypothetical protein
LRALEEAGDQPVLHRVQRRRRRERLKRVPPLALKTRLCGDCPLPGDGSSRRGRAISVPGGDVRLEP